ncbi:sensor histidine kinase [Enterobacteriaceae bacterium 89]|nr:sensor histidine kinase [Enterobacteriaceae bacterium 89]
MAGRKKWLKNAVQLRLSVGLSVAILLTALLSGGLTYYLALDEANELQDDTLSQIAQLINYVPAQAPALDKTAQKMEGEVDASIAIAFLSPDASAQNVFELIQPFRSGFQDVQSHGQHYRVLVHQIAGGSLVAVGQLRAVRDEIASESALRTLIPLAILLPILLLVANDLTRKSFRPMLRLAEEVNQRDERDLTPFADEGIPDEVRPFVVGINKLLQNIATAMQTQKRFIADAAHELRTPLTALTLQAEHLSATDMPPLAHQRLVAMRQGLSRTNRLLEQLLIMAREQQAPQAETVVPVSVESLFRELIEDLLPLASEKSIDLGVVNVPLAGQPLLIDKNSLYVTLKNVIENAIRYIPPEGQIDLSARLEANRLIVEVEDNGPGIPAEERERVFDAFYRPEGTPQPGSGLGLSIVKACVNRLGGQITLKTSQRFPSGLLVQIALPAAVR